MQNTQLLDWDSKMLGIPVAKITYTHLSKEKLIKILQKLKSQGIQLVYWAAASQSSFSQVAARACAGLLVDEKLTYCLDLATLHAFAPPATISIYPAAAPNRELQALALEIAQFSRFSHDPHISPATVKKLYTTWINNACKKTVAKVVLVLKLQNHIVGMVTIDEKQGRGDLSLLAVDPRYQGTGLGKRLVRAAQAWCVKHGYSISQVVTQKNNVKACRLYESCGYRLEKMECFYHFWL
jgi:dTDP-4-amino-4,6-dideoxy-D-galactose acyltransferase